MPAKTASPVELRPSPATILTMAQYLKDRVIIERRVTNGEQILVRGEGFEVLLGAKRRSDEERRMARLLQEKIDAEIIEKYKPISDKERHELDPLFR